MSRVGKKPILIPENVEVKIEGQEVTVKGLKGELTKEIRPEIKVEVKENLIILSPQIPSPALVYKGGAKVEKKETSSIETPKQNKFATGQTKKTKAFWGLSRALIFNMVKGVTEGYEKKLEIKGVGFRASLEGKNLVLHVGFTHPVKIEAPEGIKFSIEKNIITVSGADIEKVSQIAAKIRKVKPPEPYKGKGIRYVGEIVRKKVGKKAITTTG